MTPTWTFYFDFISPYAFLGWRRIRPLAERLGRRLDPVPVLFAGLLEAHGTKGPAEVPAKRRYLGKDLARKAHRLGISGMRPPPAHPFNPLVALRVATVADAERRPAVVDALFDAAWTAGRAIDTPGDVATILTEAGLDGAQLVSAAATPEAKAKLRANTDEALNHGIFGVPTIFGEGEIFWGTDAIDDLELRAEGKMPSFAHVTWEDLPVGIQRKF